MVHSGPDAGPHDSFPPLVSTEWLARHLGEAGLRILDASWYMPSSGRDARAEFETGHIPGAGFFDLELASDPDSPLPHTLPSPERFADYAGRLGVSNTSLLVIYDGSGVNLSAARAWWMFRTFGHRLVAVLDGGSRKWIAEARPMEAGALVLPAATFSASLDSGAVRNFEQVHEALESGAAQVVDMRSRGRFAGLDPEPRSGVPSGHMPGAINLPFTELVGPEGRLLPADELRRLMLRSGLHLGQPVIGTCGSGTSACALLLALRTLGQDDVALYDGSWTEWVSRAGAIETGPAQSSTGD